MALFVNVTCEFFMVFVTGDALRAIRAQRASVRSLHAHTAPPSHTESIESAQVLYSIGHCGFYSCISGTNSGGSTKASPFSLTTVVFFACLSAVARRRRPVRLPLRHPRALHCHVTAQSC